MTRLWVLAFLGTALGLSRLPLFAAAEPAEPGWRDWTVEVVTPLTDSPGKVFGSGFVISTNGYVLTNRHVIEVENKRTAVFADGKTYPVRYVAAPRHLDLALLKIEAPRTFTPLRLGRSSVLKVGQPVFASGNPGGAGLKLSRGGVTGIGLGWIWGGPYSEQMIRFDAPIKGGNSGGPLINGNGEGIGVIFCVAEGVADASFAVPMDGTLEFMVKTLDEQGHFPFASGLTVPGFGAATVTTVAPDSPAAKAGLKAGDVIQRCNDTTVLHGFDFHLDLIGRKAGESLRLKLLREGKPFDATVELAPRPPTPPKK